MLVSSVKRLPALYDVTSLQSLRYVLYRSSDGKSLIKNYHNCILNTTTSNYIVMDGSHSDFLTTELTFSRVERGP